MFCNGTFILVAFTAHDVYLKCVGAHGVDVSGEKWLFNIDVHRANGSLHDVFSKCGMKRVLSMRLYGVTTFHRCFNEEHDIAQLNRRSTMLERSP